jgi:ubiquinone/menaquinone biosynthesis C-methylase UbiE
VSVEHWETYYRGGALATCPIGPDANYSLGLRDAWVEFFASLPDGATVLDVGTGNGAVALIARDAATAAGRTFEIHGTDLAQIDPPRQVRGGATMFDGIAFHPGVATERLPFEAGTFDGVSGQFALEYTEVESALREIFRVLKAGGRARFSVHHSDSVVVQNARESLSQAHLVLDETRVYRRLRAFVTADREAAGRPKATAAWNELNSAAARLQQAGATSSNAHVLRVTVDAVQKLLAARTGLSAAQLDREIDGVERELRSSVRRLQDLAGAARSEESILEMARTATRVGFDVEMPRPQFQSGSILVAWLLDLRRPADAGGLYTAAHHGTQ